jgi:hypothetical protein
MALELADGSLFFEHSKYTISTGKKAVYFNRSQRTMIQHLSLSTLRGIDMRGSSVVAGSCGMRPGY